MTLQYTPISEIQEAYQQQRALSNQRDFASPTERIEQLKRLRKSIAKYEAELLEALKTDLGKSNYEGFLTEIGVTYQEIDYHIKHVKHWSAHRRITTPWFLLPSSSEVIPEPFGQVLIMAPWNYPFQLLMNPLIGAISAGNRAILRPSPEVPNVAVVIGKVIAEAFAKEEVFVVQGSIDENQWLLQQQWDYIFFTGGPFLGKIVAKAAAEKLIPVTLELGGKSPAIIEKGCDMKAAAKRVMWGKSVNAGQTCIAPDYVWVHQSDKQAFIDAAKVALEQMYSSDLSASPDFGRIVNERSFDRVAAYLQGAEIVLGGKTDRGQKFIETTVVSVDGWSSPVMCEEVFGPILPLRTYETLDEVIADVNAHEKPLALYFFGSDAGAEMVLAKTSSGGVSINDTLVHVANHHLPFGGVGGSGYGSYRGKHTFEVFSHKKSVMRSPLWFNVPIKYPPYKGLGLLRRILG
ncbi:MAG: aldehyde dehydrogenase family protein [Bacteroidetes bacterium]|nr:aldehyde dehydrogenase family protein [Bacteroidota bacterium]